MTNHVLPTDKEGLLSGDPVAVTDRVAFSRDEIQRRRDDGTVDYENPVQTINFTVVGDSDPFEIWTFDTKENRDAIYQNLLERCGCTNGMLRSKLSYRVREVYFDDCGSRVVDVYFYDDDRFVRQSRFMDITDKAICDDPGVYHDMPLPDHFVALE